MKKFLCFVSILLAVVAIISAVYALSPKKDVILLNEE